MFTRWRKMDCLTWEGVWEENRKTNISYTLVRRAQIHVYFLGGSLYDGAPWFVTVLLREVVRGRGA